MTKGNEKNILFIRFNILVDEVNKLSQRDDIIESIKKEIIYLKDKLNLISKLFSKLADVDLGNNFVNTCIDYIRFCRKDLNDFNIDEDKSKITSANVFAEKLKKNVFLILGIPQSANINIGSEGHISYETDGKENDRYKIVDAGLKRPRDLVEFENKLISLNDFLFTPKNGEEGLGDKIKKRIEEIEVSHKSITDFNNKIFSGSDSIYHQITGYERDIEKLLEKFTLLVGDAEKEKEKIKKYSDDIFGMPDHNNEKLNSHGLKYELEERIKNLDAYEVENRKRHDAMFKHIEDLVPGATSAGLSTAYCKLKDSFKNSIRNYTIAFYLALVCMLIFSLLMVLDISTSPLKISVVKVGDWDEMLRSLLNRAPVVIPIVWLAVFSATRRSQYERLQQEYAHKEAIASSYESYKKQLNDLKINSDDLQKELIGRSIESISYNASRSLDGKHIEIPPILKVLEKFSVDDLKKMIEMVKAK